MAAPAVRLPFCPRYPMNYLAHLYFADDSTESQLGNLMADFVKGPLDRRRYTPDILKGIENHRTIDRFTDTHAVVRESKRLVNRHRRRFAGIIVDVCYDYFLAKHWSRYSDIELPAFIERVYASLRRYRGALPGRMGMVLHYMIEQDWLSSYRTTAGIGRALDGISTRIKRSNTLRGGVEELERNYEAMEDHFLAFFPELIDHIEEKTCEAP